MLTKFYNQYKKRKAMTAIAIQHYNSAVKQARLPLFYTDYKVADSIDGRFDVLALHLYIVLSRLNTIEGGADIQQQIADIMIADMDKVVRDLGVGDMGCLLYTSPSPRDS